MYEILIVSSNLELRGIIRKHLKTIGMKVSETDRGFSAISKINELKFRCVILDQNTHDNSSLSVSHFIVATDKNIRIVLLTMRNDMKYIRDSRIRIGDKAITAPYTLEKILESLQ